MLSVILALIVEYIHAWMDKIKKGRTNVVEKDHVVILGWSDVCFALVRELDLSTDDGVTIVVLCPLDRKELSHRVRDDLPKGSKSRVIVRNGFPGNVTDLVTVGVNYARAIIVPAPPGNADEADNYVLNVVMALKAIGNVPCADAHIIAELRDVDNEVSVMLDLTSD
jgi:voltage-gated potassium channel Kch